MKIYFVKEGDTLYEIAQQKGVDLNQLIAMNPHIADPDHISPGMKLYLPSGQGGNANPPKVNTGPVQAGNPKANTAPIQTGVPPKTNTAPIASAETPKATEPVPPAKAEPPFKQIPIPPVEAGAAGPMGDIGLGNAGAYAGTNVAPDANPKADANIGPSANANANANANATAAAEPKPNAFPTAPLAFDPNMLPHLPQFAAGAGAAFETYADLNVNVPAGANIQAAMNDYAPNFHEFPQTAGADLCAWGLPYELADMSEFPGLQASANTAAPPLPMPPMPPIAPFSPLPNYPLPPYPLAGQSAYPGYPANAAHPAYPYAAPPRYESSEQFGNEFRSPFSYVGTDADASPTEQSAESASNAQTAKTKSAPAKSRKKSKPDRPKLRIKANPLGPSARKRNEDHLPWINF